MSGAEILRKLSAKGVRVWPAGDKIRFAPRSAVDADLLGAMRTHKPELLAVLIPREMSMSERVATGHVPEGWRPERWAARLRQMADACRQMHPERAGELEAWASNVGGKVRHG